jgi:uncharacterized protein
MGYAGSDQGGNPQSVPVAIKILIAGGFGVGKTTLVSSLTEIRPLQTEEDLSAPGAYVDLTDGVEQKTTTTVAMDFGRITLAGRRVLYLFGTPGQERFWFMWDDLSYGALGAVVLADTRRLADCFASIDYFEKRQLPFVVAINCFDGAHRYDPAEVRAALELGPRVPVVLCDARQAESAKNVLITLVELVLDSTPDEDSAIRAAPGAPPLVLGVAGARDITDDRV